MNKTRYPVALFTLGALVIFGLWFLLPLLRDRAQRQTSDAGAIKATIRCAHDNFVGYFILRSPELKKRLRQKQVNLKCGKAEDDNANYAERMQKLEKGEIDIAVMTVDTDVLNGFPVGYPGVIAFVIDESRGADAVLASKASGIKNLNDLKGKTNIRVTLTRNSPSHHLGKVAVTHFGIPELLKNIVPADGSPDALSKVLSDVADIGIVWEPDVSRGLEKGAVKLLGTEETSRVVVDVLLVNRKFGDRNPGLMLLLIDEYFQVLKYYRDNLDILRKEVAEEAGIKDLAVIDVMLRGVYWVNLTENCMLWFGCPSAGANAEFGLAKTIDSTVAILLANKDFPKNPLPDQSAESLIRSVYLDKAYAVSTTGTFTTAGATKAYAPVPDSLTAVFKPLPDEAWKVLRVVATLRDRPISFQSGTATLDTLGKEELDEAIENLSHYPKFRLIVKGHTALRGDSFANKALSQDRADAAKRYVTVTYGIDENRIQAVGRGSEEPLKRLPGENDRSYSYRLPRIELLLVAEVY